MVYAFFILLVLVGLFTGSLGAMWNEICLAALGGALLYLLMRGIASQVVAARKAVVFLQSVHLARKEKKANPLVLLSEEYQAAKYRARCQQAQAVQDAEELSQQIRQLAAPTSIVAPFITVVFGPQLPLLFVGVPLIYATFWAFYVQKDMMRLAKSLQSC